MKPDPKYIWLSPACTAEDDERTWCEDDQGPCDECGLPSVMYIRADLAQLREKEKT